MDIKSSVCSVCTYASYGYIDVLGRFLRYKVIFDISPPLFKMIAFIIENKGNNQPLKTFVVTVDQVEKVSGLDFFSELPDIIEDKLERKVNISSWFK